MALTAKSTYDEVLAAYDDNSDYDVVGSTAKAKVFAQACRILIGRTAETASRQGDGVTTRTAKFERELDRAQRWIRRRSGRARFRHVSFEGYRS